MRKIGARIGLDVPDRGGVEAIAHRRPRRRAETFDMGMDLFAFGNLLVFGGLAVEEIGIGDDLDDIGMFEKAQMHRIAGRSRLALEREARHKACRLAILLFGVDPRDVVDRFDAVETREKLAVLPAERVDEMRLARLAGAEHGHGHRSPCRFGEPFGRFDAEMKVAAQLVDIVPEAFRVLWGFEPVERLGGGICRLLGRRMQRLAGVIHCRFNHVDSRVFQCRASSWRSNRGCGRSDAGSP